MIRDNRSRVSAAWLQTARRFHGTYHWHFSIASSIGVYGIIIGLLSGRLSLWVDEVLQLIGTRDAADVGHLLRWISINPGGVPLGYFTQYFLLSMVGFSQSAARLPSIVCSVIGCGGIVILGRALGLSRTAATISLALFAILPMQFRYALEARPYAEALLFCIASQIAFNALCRRPNWKWGAIYCVALSMGIYTQPFVLFIWVSHLVWAVLFLKDVNRTMVIGWCTLGGSIALLAFLPWFLLVKDRWHSNIEGSGYSFQLSLSTLSIMFREVTGNYIIAILLCPAVAFGLKRRSQLSSRSKALLTLNILLPVICTLGADMTFNYFFAARQLLFVLPALTVLAAAGIANLLRNRASLAITLFCVLILAATAQNVRMFLKPRENWALAARSINSRLRPGSCFLTAPPEWAPLYVFFEPALDQHLCGNDHHFSYRVLLAQTPYTAPEAIAAVRSVLAHEGYILEQEDETGGSHLQILVKP